MWTNFEWQMNCIRCPVELCCKEVELYESFVLFYLPLAVLLFGNLRETSFLPF